MKLAKALGVARFILYTAFRSSVHTRGLGRIDRVPTLRLARKSSVVFGKRVRIFPGVRIETYAPEAQVRIGDRTYLNRRVEIHAASEVVIGSDCAVSWNVVFMDHDAHSIGGRRHKSAICVGNKVWIGQGVTILKGVSIGDGAVVGAGAVVTKDVPPGALVAGNPARVVRTNVTWAP
jgi:acetyltransferase-like isoleucine patch superfamily enzyme